MKNSQLKLDLLSAINPEILDRVDNMRAKYMFGNKKRRNNGWLPWVAMAACLCIVAGTLFAFLPSLLSTDKQVPIYQGMTVSSANPLANHGSTDVAAHTSPLALYSDLSAPRVIPLTDSKPTPPKPTPPHEKHTEPLTDGMTGADTQRPAPTIEASDQIAYYAKPNEDFYITVHVSNPDNYEILSFTLNGKVYSSYMFEQGSDMEHLILKCNVGDAEGIVEYTIDAIKYIDGEQIRDVRMDGDRTIIIGVSTEKQPAATLASQETGLNKLTLRGTLDDTLGLVNISHGEFYALLVNAKDNSLIEKQTLTLEDAFEVTFSGLATGTDYICRIMADYDALDGTGFNSYVLAELAVSTQAFVAFEDITIGKGEIEFNLAWDDNVQKENIVSLVLYKGDTEERQLNITDIKVDGLLSHTTYTLVATYRNGEAIETVSHTFTTLQKTVPTLNITAGDATYSDLSFDVTFIDIDHVGSITKIELLHGEDEPIVAENTDVRSFENLLSNNNYVIQVTVTYDLNDGLGEQSLISTSYAKTQAYDKPQVSLDDLSAAADSISGHYTVTDKHQKTVSTLVELYKDNSRMSTAASTSFTFKGLDSYTLYTVKIVLTYDLQDGRGKQTTEIEKRIRTYPNFEITNLKLLGSDTIPLNGTIAFQVTIDHPSNVPLKSLVINGQTIMADNISQASGVLYINIINEGQFGGGDIRFVIEQVTLEDSSQTFVLTPKPVESQPVKVKIGTANIKEICFVNQDLEPVEVVFPSDTTLLMLKLDNPDGLDLSKVTFDDPYSASRPMTYPAKVWTKIDNDTYVHCCGHPSNELKEQCPYAHGGSTFNPGNVKLSLLSVTFQDQENTLEIPCENYSSSVYFIRSDEIKYISTPEDLMDVDDRFYYQLTQDIDLADIQWTSPRFDGYLNGNGYVIKNMTIFSNQTQLDNSTSGMATRIGLFSTSSGIIHNVHLENASVMVQVTVAAPFGHFDHLRVGCLVGHNDEGKITQCSVDKNSLIHLNLYAKAGSNLSNTTYVVRSGGLVGDSSYGSMEDCLFEGTLTYTANDYETGAWLCYRNGGICGTVHKTIIKNCLVTGSLLPSKPDTDGNIFGEADSLKLVASSVDLGLSQIPTYGHHYMEEDSPFVNVYTLKRPQDGILSCTIAQLNTKSFWTDVLGWDEDVWNLDDLDYENGKIPTLRREHK